jgi:hypothetical protein
MTLNQFIFSDQPKIRFARHLVFWLIFSLHFVIQNLMIGGPGEGKTSRTFIQSFLHFLYFLPIYLLSTYVFIGFILPGFLFRQRYIAFTFYFLLLFTLNFIAVYYSGMAYLHIPPNQVFNQSTIYANKYHAIVDGLFVPFMLFGITAGVKFSKKWFQQQRENERLAKQKLATELQLLKTSIHPRFLFHSLHTVQRYINNSPAQSSALILELSDLLSYVLYEKDENWVELEKELEIIRHYIDLEEKGFADKLKFETEFPENTKGKFIVPFLLISIVESSFEYFFETGQKKPFLKLIVAINENVLHCQLLLSRPGNKSMDIILPDKRLLAVQKQLQNQYANLHYLQVTSDNKSYSVDLKLPLYSGDLINIKKNRLPDEIPEPV